MSIPDPLMPRYFALTTGWRPDRVAEVDRRAGRRLARAGRRPSACSAARSPTCTTVPGRARRPRPSSTGCSRRARSRPTCRTGAVARAEFPMRLARLLAVDRARAVQQGGPAQDRAGRRAPGGGEGGRSRTSRSTPTRSTGSCSRWASGPGPASWSPEPAAPASEGVEDEQADDRGDEDQHADRRRRPAWRRRPCCPCP